MQCSFAQRRATSRAGVRNIARKPAPHYVDIKSLHCSRLQALTVHTQSDDAYSREQAAHGSRRGSCRLVVLQMVQVGINSVEF